MGIRRIGVVLALAAAALQPACPAPAAAGGAEVDVYVRQPLACHPADEITVRISMYNRTDANQTFRGEPTDANGRLVLGGDWDLVVEEIKHRKVVGTTSLRPERRPAGEAWQLKARGYRDWRAKLPARRLLDRAGIVRFRVSCGGHTATGRPLRIAEDLAAPEWVKLTYTPDKRQYALGEPIEVHFVMKNDGAEDFHFEEGGDYRGATRHLRYAFTAESADGKKAADPRPRQACFGGMGMSDPCLAPGKTYEKSLPLLAYLAFPAPGRYIVRCYQALGFGTPDKPAEPYDHFRRVYGGRFEIELRTPDAAEIKRVLDSLLAEGDEHQRRYKLSLLHQPCYLGPLCERLAAEADASCIEALACGIGAVQTVESTRRLIGFAGDKRPAVRLAALGRLKQRMPGPKDRTKAKLPGCQWIGSLCSDANASWSETLRAPLREALQASVKAASVEEAAAAADCTGLLCETDMAGLLAEAADRAAPRLPVSKAARSAVHRIGIAAQRLAQLGARPCKADKASSPGRLAVWAHMVRPERADRPAEWQDLLVHMLNLPSPVTRLAAIVNPPAAFDRFDDVPWKELLLSGDFSIRFHAIQVARRKFRPGLRAIAAEGLQKTDDKRARHDFQELIKEIDARARKAKHGSGA